MEHRAPIVTGKAEIMWSADGRTVTKTYDEWSTPVLGSTIDSFTNELAVNRLLLEHPPPFRTPMLVAADHDQRALTFEAIAGEPLGPKFPMAMTDAEVTAIIDVISALACYSPESDSVRSFPLKDRLTMHVAAGLIDEGAAQRIDDVTSSRPWQFAHGDVTARNVLRSDDEVWLIDWEWAGAHPSHYDVAFFWFSLVDVAGGRERVQSSIRPGDRISFIAAASLVQLLHLQMWRDRGTPVSKEFYDTHTRALACTLDELVL
jgi:Phosphotransferase enzyme family